MKVEDPDWGSASQLFEVLAVWIEWMMKTVELLKGCSVCVSQGISKMWSCRETIEAHRLSNDLFPLPVSKTLFIYHQSQRGS